MRQTFIIYNDVQLNALLKAEKLGYVSIIDVRYYEHKDTKEFLFNTVSVKGSKITMRVMEKIVELFDPKKEVSWETIVNNKFEITDGKCL